MNAQATDAGRNDGIDALRGLFLVLMTFTHMPTSLQSALGQPLGQISAAEGFVLLSAFLAGQVYLRRGLRSGFEAMRQSLWARAGTVYRHHLGLFAFGISMVLVVGMVNGRDAVTNLFMQYLAHPVSSAGAALVFVYQPALLDILPMYVMFLLLTPWILEYARRNGWGLPLAVSIAIWASALMGLRTGFYDAVLAWTKVPLPATGSFNIFAWQFMWVIGLWLGTARTLGHVSPLRVTNRMLVLVCVLAASFLAWRHIAGQVPFGIAADGAPLPANRLTDKWDLGPLRLMNVFAIAILIAAFGPALARRLPLRGLALLGRSSLPVFSAHIACCLLALACFGEPTAANTIWQDAALILASLLAMYTTAHLHQLANQEPQPTKTDRRRTHSVRAGALASEDGPGAGAPTLVPPGLLPPLMSPAAPSVALLLDGGGGSGGPSTA
jgi:hypothetical protein